MASTDAIANAEVNKLLFVAWGGPALVAGGLVATPAVAGYVSTTAPWLSGSLAFNTTSFTVGGAFGGAFGGGFEYSKNEVFGLQHTPGGYAGSIALGGLAGTGLQTIRTGSSVAKSYKWSAKIGELRPFV